MPPRDRGVNPDRSRPAAAAPDDGTGPDHFPSPTSPSATAALYIDRHFAARLRESLTDGHSPARRPTQLRLTLAQQPPRPAE
jgi:hypothetical protein